MTDPQPVLAALADPTRRAVFERLTSQGPASASLLAEELPVSRQAIAKHLGQLDAVGGAIRTRARGGLFGPCSGPWASGGLARVGRLRLGLAA